MTVDKTRYGVGFVTPAFPYPPEEYNQQSFIQLDTALRNATTDDRAEATSWFLS